MKLVGSGSERKTGDSLTRPAEFRGRVECHNLKFAYRILGEREIAKVPGPFGGTAHDRPVELKFIAGTLASIHRGVQHARRAAVRDSPARHARSQGHKVSRVPLFSYPDNRQFE